MMSLIARSSERAPAALSSTASESPGKTRQESQSPLSAHAEMYDRTGNLLFAVIPVTSATDSLKKHTYQATQNGILIELGLLKSGVDGR